jgi:hypothetical protein
MPAQGIAASMIQMTITTGITIPMIGIMNTTATTITTIVKAIMGGTAVAEAFGACWTFSTEGQLLDRKFRVICMRDVRVEAAIPRRSREPCFHGAKKHDK